MNLPHKRARRLFGVAMAAVLAVVGVGIATPATAATATLTVNGTVLDSSSAPVADQAVQLYTSAGSYNAVTDASGQFTVAVEYDTDMAYVSVNAGYANAYIDPPSLGGATETSVVLTLPDVVTVTIEGYVTDAYGTPLPGTPVWASSQAGYADASAGPDGHYALTVDALSGGSIMVQAVDYHNMTSLSGYSDGDTVRQDFTIGTGNVSSIEIQGVFLGVDGLPVPNEFVYLGTDQGYFYLTSDANGEFTQTVEYGEFGFVYLSADHADLQFDLASLVGQSTISVVLQKMPPAHVTIEGTVYDLASNPVAGQLLLAYGETSDYGWSDAAGHYSLSVLADPFTQFTLELEDGENNPYDISGYRDGDVVTRDVVVSGSGYEIGIPGPLTTCDINGDGFEDAVSSRFMITSGRNDWLFQLDEDGWDWGFASFGEGELTAVYCADLNGDGASELIAQGSHDKLKKSGDTVTKNDWWIYDYTTDTATQRTFPNGEISGVVFENLDADPGVEMIVERLRESGPNTFWILDDATAEIEKIRVGFGTGGTLEFADFDGVAGIDIVTTKVRPNGTTVTEYYTRASGQGEIVTVKVKANGTAQ